MDIDDLLEKVKSLEHRLFIKYSLVQHPTEAQIAKWYELTNQFISDGVEPEQAAKKAAVDSFEVDPSMIRKTQADTIEALLLMARKKVEEKTKDD